MRAPLSILAAAFLVGCASAELLAWTAFSARASTAAGAPWQEFSIVARELLSDRPLADIGLMRRIAERTAEAHDDRGWA